MGRVIVNGVEEEPAGQSDRLARAAVERFRKALHPGGITDELWSFVEYVAERGQEVIDDGYRDARGVLDTFVESANNLKARRRKTK